MARLGAGVDDLAAVALFFKRFYRSLNAPDNAFNVDIVDFIDDVLANLFDRRRGRDPGVVNDHVKTAKAFTRLLNGGKNLIAFRDIDLHRQRLAAVLVNFVSNRLCGGIVIIGDGHGKAILNQAKGDSFTDTLACAGHECDFFHCWIPSVVTQSS